MPLLTDLLKPTLTKVRQVDLLPTYSEAIEILRLISEATVTEISSSHIDFKGVFNLWNVEFVDALADELRCMGPPIVEVGAGNGKLSYHLRQRGIPVIATDDYSGGITQNHSIVERLTHIGALAKYLPSTVLASGVPYIANDVLEFHTVDCFIQIYAINRFHPDIPSRMVLQRLGFHETILERVQAFGVSSGDYYPNGLGHTVVSLLSRQNNH